MNSDQTTDTTQKKKHMFEILNTTNTSVSYTSLVCGLSLMMVQKGSRYVGDNNNNI